VNYEVLALAVLLHDIARGEESRGHAKRSAEIAERLLRELGCPEDRIQRVVEAIRTHSFSAGETPRSLEARILSDADKLDAIGAVGVARCFTEGGLRRRDLPASIYHFYEKLLRLRSVLYTPEARQLAERRHRFLEMFLQEFYKDLRESTLQ